MSIVEGTRDQVSIQIDARINKLSRISSEPYIFKVCDRLKSPNKKAYEPEVVAIGPYHRGNSKLNGMEGKKLQYLQQLLRRRNEDSVNRYVVAMRNIVEEALGFYADPISLSQDEFVEMLVLDGCFIIEFFVREPIPGLRDTNDMLFESPQLIFDITRDLLLVENQLPFFVLNILFNMTESGHQIGYIISAALGFFTRMLAGMLPSEVKEEEVDTSDIKHLVCLLHRYLCSPVARTTIFTLNVQGQGKSALLMISSATELKEAGVKFKKVEGRALFDIRFSKGVLEIPCLTVGDQTDFVARNMIAYEQYLPYNYPRYVSNYFIFIDCLVNSSKDVKLLREQGIIENLLGDNEMVATFINKLCDGVFLSNYDLNREIYLQVNNYSSKTVNRWMAYFNHNYLNTPWASISLLAAALLLLLTVAQTVFSIIK